MANAANAKETKDAFPVPYEIVQIENWTVLDARGNPTPGYKITFTFLDGMSDTVDVPEKQYTAERVRGLIEQKITRHLEVLSG